MPLTLGETLTKGVFGEAAKLCGGNDEYVWAVQGHGIEGTFSGSLSSALKQSIVFVI